MVEDWQRAVEQQTFPNWLSHRLTVEYALLKDHVDNVQLSNYVDFVELNDFVELVGLADIVDLVDS